MQSPNLQVNGWKAELVKKTMRGNMDMPYSDLLPAAKKKRVEQYRKMSKVQAWLANDKEVVARRKLECRLL